MGHYFSYAYDPVGNILFKKIQDGTTAYSYDAADELVSETAADKVTLYAYDPNGNETKAGDTRYTYDLENKLLSAKGAGKPVSYTYTGDGLMSTRSTPSEFTAYVWDTSSDLGQLALETSSKGKQKGTQAYTYGAGPIGIVSSSGSYSFHTDSLGSVVELSDSSAHSLESYRYSAFGDAYAPGNSDQAASNLSNLIRFAGQYLDLVSDLYNMRAREYDPETGRFLQVDPLEAGVGEAYLGVYTYADNQPTVKTDPSGMCPVGGSSCSLGMRLQSTIRANGSYEFVLRNRIWRIVLATIPREKEISYSEDLVSPHRRMQGVREHFDFPRLPKWEDCSSYATWIYWTAGVPKDPMGNRYNGSPYNNNTGNLSCDPRYNSSCNSQLRRSHVVTPQHAQRGDLVFYGGGWPWSHVEIYMGNSMVVGNGKEEDPVKHSIGSYSQIRSYFPELLDGLY